MTRLLLLGLLAAVSARAELVENTVTYQHGDTTLEGFHVHDDAKSGPRPAVLVIHQWTGLSDYEKRRSRQLAEMGYNVFAARACGRSRLRRARWRENTRATASCSARG